MIERKSIWIIMKPNVWLSACFTVQTDKRTNGWLYKRIAAQTMKRLINRLVSQMYCKTNVCETVKTSVRTDKRMNNSIIICIAIEFDGYTNSRSVSYSTEQSVNQSISRKII